MPKLQEIFLNKTSQQILEQSNGKNPVCMIIENLSAMYEKVGLNTLKKDIIRTLSVLSQYLIISWERRNPFMKNLDESINGYRFEVLDEGDIRELLEFNQRYINNNEMFQYIHLMGEKKMYLDEIYLREMLFNFEEDFFVIKKDNTIRGLITLKYHKNKKSTVCSIGTIVSEKEDIEVLLKGIMQYSKSVCTRKMNKIKLQMIYNNSAYFIYLSALLEKTGFICEGVLKQEVNGNDIVNYCYLYY